MKKLKLKTTKNVKKTLYIVVKKAYTPLYLGFRHVSHEKNKKGLMKTTLINPFIYCIIRYAAYLVLLKFLAGNLSGD